MKNRVFDTDNAASNHKNSLCRAVVLGSNMKYPRLYLCDKLAICQKTTDEFRTAKNSKVDLCHFQHLLDTSEET